MKHMKYSGWAEIKSIKEKWEKKPTLYAVKMNNGYCFFQYAGGSYSYKGKW